jgi:hypothetical protein
MSEAAPLVVARHGSGSIGAESPAPLWKGRKRKGSATGQTANKICSNKKTIRLHSEARELPSARESADFYTRLRASALVVDRLPISNPISKRVSLTGPREPAEFYTRLRPSNLIVDCLFQNLFQNLFLKPISKSLSSLRSQSPEHTRFARAKTIPNP